MSLLYLGGSTIGGIIICYNEESSCYLVSVIPLQKMFYDNRIGIIQGELNVFRLCCYGVYLVIVISTMNSALIKVAHPLCLLCFIALLSLKGLMAFRQASSTVEGNLKGDGTLLGGSLVVGPGNQGIIFQHQSRGFGDRAKLEDIVKAIENIESN